MTSFRQMPLPTLRVILSAAVLIGLVAGSGIKDIASGASEAPLNHPTTLSRHTLPDFADLVA